MRKTQDLCQDCWQNANPGDYAPMSHTYGECRSCAADGLIYRSRAPHDDEPGPLEGARAMRKSVPVNAPTYAAARVAVADLLTRQGRPWRVLPGVQIVDGTRRSIAPAATTSPDSAVALTVTRPTGERRTYFVTIERWTAPEVRPAPHDDEPATDASDDPATPCAHAPTTDGTACAYCGLAAEPVGPDELAAVLIGELSARGAIEPTRCASSDCIGYHGHR